MPPRTLLFPVLLATLHQAPAGTIAGRVTFEDSGLPAPDVATHCVARGSSRAAPVLTNSEGRYSCTVPAGVYRVRAELSRLETLYLSQTYGVTYPGDEGLGIRIRANARVEVPFVLRRSGTISGRVLDDHGDPVKDAIVTAFRELLGDQPSLERPMERAVAIGDGGRFAVSGLSPGAYRIRVEPPPRAAADKDGRRLVPTWYPAATDPRHSIPVLISGDELAGVDLALARSRLPVVSGVVFRADGAPAGGERIGLHARIGNYAIYFSTPVTTGAKGDFTFPAVEPGAYEISAAVAGDLLETLSAPLVVGASDVSGLQLSLSAAVVSGRVIPDDHDFPVASVDVVTREVSPFAVDYSAKTDAKWGFVLPRMSGSRLLRVRGLPNGWWLKSVTAARRDVTNEPVDLTDGLDGVEIRVTRQMLTLSGEVEAGAGLAELPADTAVLIFSDDPSQWIVTSTAIARAWPTEEGTFVAEGLPAGQYRVIAVAATPAGFLRAIPDVLRSLSPRATLVTLRHGAVNHLTLRLARRE